MLNSHGHWSLGHSFFVPENPKKKENTFFQKSLEILWQCVSEKWVQQKNSVSENCVPEKKSISEKCIPENKFTLKYCSGKEIYSQIF
jgi:hypothetical protein